MRVLLVEDEFELATALVRGLENNGVTTEVAATGEAAIELLDDNGFDVVVLDRRLPGLSGDDLCRWLRDRGTDARVLMLTAADEVEDRVAGLSLGADDYVGKPVALAELVARIEPSIAGVVALGLLLSHTSNSCTSSTRPIRRRPSPTSPGRSHSFGMTISTGSPVRPSSGITPTSAFWACPTIGAATASCRKSEPSGLISANAERLARARN